MSHQPLTLRGFLLPMAVGLAALAYSCATPRGFVGTEFEPARPAPPIALTDHNDQPFRLDRTRGQVVLVYFGYTHCPDECPLTMAKLTDAFDLLNEDGNDVRVLLVTTDPVRDTAGALQSYLRAFHPSFLGLTGTAAELEPIYQAYGVVVMDDGETHTNRIYVIDARGDLRLTMPYEATASEIASDLKTLLAEP